MSCTLVHRTRSKTSQLYGRHGFFKMCNAICVCWISLHQRNSVLVPESILLIYRWLILVKLIIIHNVRYVLFFYWLATLRGRRWVPSREANDDDPSLSYRIMLCTSFTVHVPSSNRFNPFLITFFRSSSFIPIAWLRPEHIHIYHRATRDVQYKIS